MLYQISRGIQNPTQAYILLLRYLRTHVCNLCTRERRRGVWRLRREGLPQGGAERGERSCCHVKTTMSEQTIESGQSSPRQRNMLLVYSDPELSMIRIPLLWPQLPLLLLFWLMRLLQCYPPFCARARQTTPSHIIRL